MKVAFFGSSEFGLPTLEALHKYFEVSLVVTNPARKARRGQKLVNTPIFECAQQLGIKAIYTPEKLDKDLLPLLKEIDWGVVVSYGKILPEAILNAVKHKFINLHPSSLPLFRGASPIERTLEAGHTKTHICVIEMEKGLDSGPILTKQEYDIKQSENSLNLHKEFAKIGANLVVNVLQNGGTCEVQNHQNATYAKKINKQELQLQPVQNTTAEVILNKIRAFASCGYCFILFNGKRFKFIEAKASVTKITPIDISCTNGFVTPLVIRPEGKGDIKITDYQF